MILSKKRIQFLLDYCKYVSEHYECWKDFWNNYRNLSVSLEFPCGEIFNLAIRGYLFAWKLQNKIRIGKIDTKDKFATQGLEGKVTIQTNLITALLVWESLPQFRCQIKIESNTNTKLRDFV